MEPADKLADDINKLTIVNLNDDKDDEEDTIVSIEKKPEDHGEQKEAEGGAGGGDNNNSSSEDIKDNNNSPDDIEDDNIQPDDTKDNNIPPDDIKGSNIQPDDIKDNNIQPEEIKENNIQPEKIKDNNIPPEDTKNNNSPSEDKEDNNILPETVEQPASVDEKDDQVEAEFSKEEQTSPEPIEPDEPVITVTDGNVLQRKSLPNDDEEYEEDEEEAESLEKEQHQESSVDDIDPTETLTEPKVPRTVEPSTAQIQKKRSFYEDINELLNDPTTSDEVKFGLLCTKIFAAMANNSIQVHEVNLITDNILKLLITDDMQRIKSSETLFVFFCDYLKMLPSKVVAEILSVLIAVLKKSLINLEMSKDLLLIAITQTFQLDNLIKHFIREIINLQTSYSCSVKELLAILKLSEEDSRLLYYIRNANLYQRNRPAAFFSFPGFQGSVMALPPFQKWPIQNGWTFVTWFRLEANSANAQPYLYYFRTAKLGLGYSAHFTGNCLVLTSMKIKGKGFQHCIPFEFVPHKWFHCAITYVTKWRSAEVKVYVNGQLTSNTEMAWQVQTNEPFDKCFIGGTPDLNDTYLFNGQIASIYLFHEALNPSQICSIHRLGASYIGQYKHPNESQMDLPIGMKRVLYEEKLSSSIFCQYAPAAVESDALCLQCSPNTTYFKHSPHAALLGKAKAIQVCTIGATLQSIGGIRALLPLLFKFAQRVDAEACSTLIGFICDLLEYSPQWFGNEMIQSHGFVTIASILSRNARLLITNETLEVLLNLTKTLLSASNHNDAHILKQLLDNILFNPSLWIYVDAKIQLKLYCYLSNEFITGATSNVIQSMPAATAGAGPVASGSNSQHTLLNAIIFNEVRRISTVLQLLHSLKYYYWLVEEKTYNVKAQDYNLRPSYDELDTIRSYILIFIKQLILQGNGIHLDELQAILNYLATVNEDANITDVLQMLQSLMCEHPASLIPAFDAKHGVQTIFKLLGSANEEIRIQALKLLGYFLSRSTQKRKQDVMAPHNLYMLLCEHLMRFTPLTINTYNALFEILTETSIESIRITNPCNSVLKIENPMILKVIATLLIEGKRATPGDAGAPGVVFNEDKSFNSIKELFINDLWSLLINNRENRRLVLQMSVWQHWLINLIENQNDLITNQILAIFRILLYHAIKYEYGGWRVWIDTLAIIHAKISFDDFTEQFGKTYRQQTSTTTSALSTSGSMTGKGKAATTNLSKTNLFPQFQSEMNTNLAKASAVPPAPTIKSKQDKQQKTGDTNDAESTVDGAKVSEDKKPDDGEDVDVDEEDEEADDADEEHEDPPKICTISSIQSQSERVVADGQIDKVDEQESTTATTSATAAAATTPTTTTTASSKDSPDVAPTRKPPVVSGGEGNTAASAKSKATATPAFRIPEFRWSSLHLKLLNDLLYSIEADLQLWRNQCSDYNKVDLSTSKALQIEQVLQSNENQIYIINAIHLISQLCDNIIISAGGLLPLLASATGGTGSKASCIAVGGEGFTASQANFLIYRLANLIDILCFTATHINFTELEAEKNMSSGGILRQCLRIACTIAVKNCLLLQKHEEAAATAATFENCHEFELISENEYLYKGVSIVQSAELFAVDFNPEMSDLINYKSCSVDIDNLHYQLITPIKDPVSLLQEADIGHLRACIYRDADSDARQSQFLALATLYFISVLMVSKYRDIIEPKNEAANNRGGNKRNSLGAEKKDGGGASVGGGGGEEANQSNLLDSIGNVNKQQPNVSLNISEKLTAKLEATLALVCPLLKEIICDFAGFLSKTLLGSHGQELITKEAIRTFKRTDASPVELVMLLCSQEWQNTLQKNAGLAFIELINEGRLLSHAMKDHIVRVAMEAEFILNRLRADDVTKHDLFTSTCIETNNARVQEENIINSLIVSAKRRDWMIFARFRESIRQEERKHFKLDTWEDDSRRRRRFVYDSLGEIFNMKLKSTPGALKKIQAEDNNNAGGEKHPAATEADEENSLSSPIVPPKSVAPVSNDDDDSDSFLWDSDDTIGDPETSPAEYSSSVLYSIECCLIWSIYTIEGILQITSNEIFFEPHNNNDIDINKYLEKKKDLGESFRGLSGIGPKGLKEFKDWDLIALQFSDLLTYNSKISFADIRAIFTRRHLLQQNGLEIFLAQRTSVMFAFSDFDTVKKVVRFLPPVGVGIKYGIPQSRRASLMTPKQLFAASNMTQRWQKREVSNFEYLMFLNTVAGRTYQDLNQYLIFPWILTNYESKELDLSLPTNFRDLSKPIGALNSERREEFIERFNSWDNASVPAFHYGTHYSTAAFTLGWLIRLQPFFATYLSLQDGTIEDESRLFTSVRDAWISSLMGGQQNVKELIPEFFYLPEIFYKNNVLDHIELPPWAESPEHFVRLHRMALESDLVSCQLHQWIDLIFGYKQKGPEAVRAVNVFYYLTYEGNIDLASVADPAIREALETQIKHFGQTPSQLTSDPHPPRSSALHVSPLMFTSALDELCMSWKFPSNAPIVHIAACTGSNHVASNNTALIVSINAHQQYFVHKWNAKDAAAPLVADPTLAGGAGAASGGGSSGAGQGAKKNALETSNLCGYLQCNYVVTMDAKFIIMCPFYDNSFRVYATDTGRLQQVVYGHKGIVTCLARSECNIAADFFIVSGSQDCSVLLWSWNAKYSQIEGNGNYQTANPLPKLTLCGHESPITSLLISGELGIVVSASCNRILIHTTGQGECITDIDFRSRYSFHRNPYNSKHHELSSKKLAGEFVCLFTFSKSFQFCCCQTM